MEHFHDGALHKQIDGVGMGSRLDPTLANAILGCHKKNGLDDYSLEYKIPN